MTTPTYDGSGEATHPSVWVFDTAWNGYTHWMAMTPYAAGNDDLENPSILASNDGQTWVVPAGLTNPIDGKPSPAAAYNADTELFYDAANDRLVCYYLEYDGTTTKYVRARTSTDGVTWSSEQAIFSTTVASSNPVSLSIRKVGATWTMWYVDTVPSPNTMVRRTATDPLGPWSAETACKVNGIASTRDNWHPMIFQDDDGIYRGIFNVCTLNNNGGGLNTLHLASSNDGLLWEVGPAILSPETGWTANRLYRASAVVTGDTLEVWYGGVSASNAWRIGYTTIDCDAFPPPI